jgi:hypothetical protein
MQPAGVFRAAAQSMSKPEWSSQPPAASRQPSAVKDWELFARHQPITHWVKGETAENRSKTEL